MVFQYEPMNSPLYSMCLLLWNNMKFGFIRMLALEYPTMCSVYGMCLNRTIEAILLFFFFYSFARVCCMLKLKHKENA